MPPAAADPAALAWATVKDTTSVPLLEAFIKRYGDSFYADVARARLDELTCTTIHGFCYDLLRNYAVEATIDPGAEILDSVQADLAFGSLFEQWLRHRLDKAHSAADPIALVAQIDPIGAEKLLRSFAECRRDHRTARPPAAQSRLGC